MILTYRVLYNRTSSPLYLFANKYKSVPYVKED